MTCRRAAAGALCAGALLLALPVAAGAAIVPGSGIAGVTLGQSEADVREALGAPVRVERGPSAFGERRDLVYQGLTVRFLGKRGGGAAAVSTGVRRQLTAGGVGVGSSEADALAGIPGLRCAADGDLRVCADGAGRGPVTRLVVDEGRVARVEIALAPKGLAAPGPAARRIVPGVGIAGARLLMTEPRLRELLGPPLRTIRRSPEILGRSRELVYRGLRVTLPGWSGGNAIAIQAESARYRTRRGVGVGSTEAAAAAGLTGERCATSGDLRTCVIGEELPGRTVTLLRLRNGRVTSVLIGIVIDSTAQALDARGVRKEYRGTVALDGVDLRGRARGAGRPAGAERRRQVDPGEDRLRPGARRAAGRVEVMGAPAGLAGGARARSATWPSSSASRAGARPTRCSTLHQRLAGLGRRRGGARASCSSWWACATARERRVETMSKGMQQRLGHRAGAGRRARACCCWTSPPAPWTRPAGARSASCSRSCAGAAWRCCSTRTC